MKILMVSMNSIHFRRWSDQLSETGHEVYWFDILDQGYAPSMSWMTQITGWKKGFLRKRGRAFIKSKLPKLYDALVHKYDTTVEVAFEKAIQELQPDLVHSFALYVSCSPILQVMNKYKNIAWCYSSWGSDLFYFKNYEDYLSDIKNVLKRVDYMFADCKRDQNIANKLGFKGTHLGVFPGGGGFDLKLFEKYRIPLHKRNIIAVKGNEDRSGRALNILKALELIKDELVDFEVVVFGATNPEVIAFKNSSIPHLTFNGIIAHDLIIKLLCASTIYIANSNSDGIPNTLLESICAGAFPIQSNPGGATEEVIINLKNGLLIEDCEDIESISKKIKMAIHSNQLLFNAHQFNLESVVPSLEREFIKEQVLHSYQKVQ